LPTESRDRVCDVKTDRTPRRRWISWTLLGLVAYAVFLVVLLPAGLVWEQARDRGMVPHGVTAQGVTGTLWRGSVASLTLPNNMVVSEMTWTFRPAVLLTGRLGWSISARPPDGHVQGRVAVGAGGVSVSGARADLDAASAAAPFLVLPIVIEGRLALDLEHLALGRDGQVRAASGVLGWLDAGAGLPEAVPLGDLRGELATGEGGALRLVVRDQGGPLIAEGTVEVGPGGRYRIDGVAGSRAGADPRLAQALRMMGNPGPDGRTPIRLSGAM
jgi:general secretion pathway protein N